MTFTTIKSFAEIVSRYDGFILDQFGVMHNGSESLPGSVECVKKLASMGKKLIILSNTSSPSQTALNKLPKLGFDPDLFIGAVTSGEEAGRYIKETFGSNGSISGNDHDHGDQEVVPIVKKAIWFTWANPAVAMTFISKCGNVQPTTNVDDADFVIAAGCDVLRGADGIGSETETGIESDVVSLGGFMQNADFSIIDPVLEQCRERGLPMVCANPDLIAKLAGGVTAHMPGEYII